MGEPDHATEPAVDMFRRGDAYHVFIDLPGLSAKDVHVRVNDWDLIVEAERPNAAAPADDLILAERPSGHWVRQIRLAQDADPSTLSADCSNGVLHLAASAGQSRGPQAAGERTVKVSAGQGRLAAAEET